MDKIILKKNKNTDSYCIYSKKNKIIKFKLKSVYLPFGREIYNKKSIINISINENNNINHNNIVILKKYSKIFSKLKELDIDYYNLKNKEYYEFINEKDNFYNIRCYLSNKCKIKHNKYIGEYDINNLTKKIINANLEIGSLWYNEKINKYGINVYITDIVVLN
tara:strand:- start:139 stop:630 length:492 start_codon:yes stop_codon:yes gene_type:complete